MRVQDFQKRIDELIDLAEKTVKTQYADASYNRWVSSELFAQLRASGLSCLRRVFGEEHPLYRQFNTKDGTK